MYACNIIGLSNEYLIWDIDTVLLRKLDYISEKGKYIFIKEKHVIIRLLKYYNTL